MPAERYHFAYADDSPYGHAVGLLKEHAFVKGGVVLDVGCGYGAIAEPVAGLGFAYVGVDREPFGPDDLRRRGFEASIVDLGEHDRLCDRLIGLLEGRPLAAIVALDVLEHLTNGPDVLLALRELSIAEGRCPLVVSVPNVAHLDLAAKLLVGRWDVTSTGLLDETHVALYGPHRLEAVFAAAGWAKVGEADFELVESDQHFPPDAPILAPTPLHDLLASLRRRAAPGATTNQFVRAYVPALRLPPAEAKALDTPFLSVLVLDGGDDERLMDTLVALDAQPLGSLEVLCASADARPGRRERIDELISCFSGLAGRAHVVGPLAGNARRAQLLDAAVKLAKGRYVTVLDDGAVPFAHWVETFARLADERPGAVVRSSALSQDLRAVVWPDANDAYEPAQGAEVASSASFELIDHVLEGGSPPGSYALPRACFEVLGLSFGEGPSGLEDDALLARAAMWCGLIEDTSTAVLLARRPACGPSLPCDREELLANLDQEPLLLPAGSLSRLVAAKAPSAVPEEELDVALAAMGAELASTRAELASTRAELASTRAEIDAILSSTSWRVTALARRLSPRRLLSRRPEG
jgi:SAM-dependent methyltransferase